MSENRTAWVYGASLVALLLYILAVVVPSWWTARQECSGTNGVIVEQQDPFRPVVCLRIQP